MKSTPLVVALLAAVAIAQRHGHHHHHLHPAQHEKRAQTVVWVTDYEYVTETVGITTTIWVSSGFVPPTSSATKTPVAAQFFETSIQIAAPSSSSTSQVYVPPAPVSPSVAPAPVAPAYNPPIQQSPPTPAPPPPAYVPPPPPPPPAPTTIAPAPAPEPAPASSGSSALCSPGNPCSGDMTYYTAGLGACGDVNDGSIDKVVALPHGLMGPLSNNNPYCGKTITIKSIATGRITTATIKDKCMGCEGYSIDLSNAAFLDLDDLTVGRTGAVWWFN